MELRELAEVSVHNETLTQPSRYPVHYSSSQPVYIDPASTKFGATK